VRNDSKLSHHQTQELTIDKERDGLNNLQQYIAVLDVIVVDQLKWRSPSHFQHLLASSYIAGFSEKIKRFANS
jgi:hypothetical protein